MSLRRPKNVGLLAAICCFSTGAHAQDRADDNAVTQAEDAFGFSLGRESLGIYSAGNTRGFSPTQAGNVRIDGLYFDPTSDLTSSLIDSVSIKVGLSAQGYPFAAPSGIVDQRLRIPASKPGASLITNFDQFGSVGVELNGSAPLSSRLRLGYGLSANRIEYTDGTDAWTHSESLIAQWRAGPVQIMPFWSLFNDYNDESSVQYVPAGAFLPKMAKAHHYEGPDWSDGRFTRSNAGLLASASLGHDWIVRLGAFRSVEDRKHGFTNLFAAEQPDGTGERITLADPPTTNRSLSGELRLTHSFSEGPRLHVVHISVRGRDAHHEFGGFDTIDNGPGRIGEKVDTSQPGFAFGELSRDRVQQLTYGIAYSGRWKNRGELGFGISRADFRKTTAIAGASSARLRSKPALYNANAAVNLTSSMIVYAGYARGLEESGVAPANAANRNQPLPVTLTKQKDVGLRFNLSDRLTAIVALFDLSRPYFGFEAGNVFTQIGTIRSRGLEFSLSGQLSPRLSLVTGGVLLRPRVTRNEDAAGVIGPVPVGLPRHDLMVDANWQTTIMDGLELDIAIRHRGRIAATTDNVVFIPARAQVDIGTHYRFKLAGKSTMLRLQLSNVFDSIGYGFVGSGLYYRQAGRYALGYLTVDL